jgi:bacterioferritin-associated ferredoxin
VCDAWLETSVPGLYVAGDARGVTGKEGALLEGDLAGLGVAKRLGRVTPERALSEAGPLRKSLDRQVRFAYMLDDLFGPLPGLWDLADDDTIVCRCEEVTLREVKEAIASGADSFAAVKAHTRVSMGRCQGRMCAQTVARILAQERDMGLDEASRRSIRPPVLPVSLEDALNSGSETESK